MCCKTYPQNNNINNTQTANTVDTQEITAVEEIETETVIIIITMTVTVETRIDTTVAVTGTLTAIIAIGDEDLALKGREIITATIIIAEGHNNQPLLALLHPLHLQRKKRAKLRRAVKKVNYREPTNQPFYFFLFFYFLLCSTYIYTYTYISLLS